VYLDGISLFKLVKFLSFNFFSLPVLVNKVEYIHIYKIQIGYCHVKHAVGKYALQLYIHLGPDFQNFLGKSYGNLRKILGILKS